MEYKQDNIGVTKPFTILVADLVDSRRVPDRAAFAKTLRATLDETAREFFEEWHAPLSVTKGIDELSGVLVRPARAYAIASFVDRAVWPQRFRWGLATGEVDVGVRGRKPGAMDGPGFHRAADALVWAKALDLSFHVEIPGVSPSSAAVVDHLANVCGLCMQSWTPAQAVVVRAVSRSATQQSAALSIGITQQAVSQAVKAGHWHEISAAEAAIGTWLSDISPGSPADSSAP